MKLARDSRLRKLWDETLEATDGLNDLFRGELAPCIPCALPVARVCRVLHSPLAQG